MKSPGICFICHEYPPDMQGGIGTFTQIVGRALVQMGWSVRVLGFQSRHYSGAALCNDNGVKVYRFPLPARDFLDVQAITMLYRTVKKWALSGEIDIVECPDAEGWMAGWPSLPIPVISRVHGSSTYFARELNRPLKTLNRWRERLSLRRSDAWCAVSAYAASKTQRLFELSPPACVSHVPVKVPVVVDPATRSTNRVVYTGTLTPKKGIERLIEAWPAVVSQIEAAELHIYGKDTRKAKLSMTEELRSRLPKGIRSSVHFHGHCQRTEVLDALNTAALAVFPSYAEAFAFAPLEAMACGCPTIYSTRTSGPELMESGKDGILIDPDAPGEISDAIISLLSGPDLRLRLGRNGRSRVENNFTVTKLVPAIDDFYRTCIRDFAGNSDMMWRRQPRTSVDSLSNSTQVRK